jgi:hypothetical protein
LPPSKLGFLVFFIGDRGEALPRRLAVIESLKTAARNWRRLRGRAGPGEYWYGKAALERWSADIGEAEQFSDEQRGNLHGVSAWNFSTMLDARKTAVAYLIDGAEVLGDETGEALCRAAAIYEEESEMIGAAAAEPEVFGGSVEEWTADARRRERETLSRSIELEEKAIAEIESTSSAAAR